VKVVCFYIILFLSTTTYFSQNLILNPSFEDSIDNCSHIMNNTTWNSSLPFAKYWFNPTDNTPDIRDDGATVCGAYSYNIGGMGYSLPQNGKVFAGLIAFSDFGNNQREYIGGTLQDTLINSLSYCLTFYIKFFNQSRYVVNKFGFYFSNDSLHEPTFEIMVYQPQIEFNDVFDDTIWTQYTATFKAEGGENYFYIGVFVPEDSLNILNLNSSGIQTYYLIDNLSLTLCPGQEEPPPPIHHSIYPNPSNGGQITIDVYDEEAVEVLVHNEIGQLIYYELLPEGATQRSIQLQLASGVYLVSFSRGGVRVKTKKVVVLK
jgi:hypothetical protein